MQTLGEIQPGQTLGRYEFLVPIAQGGMAAVWAARLHGTRGFSKTVAIKTMLPTISDDPMFEQMFLDEATIASNIRHPNVVQIQDLGEQNDILYLVMEWVDGEPLSAIRRAAAKEGGIPRNIAVRIVADACAGLHAAHELKDETGEPLGLVHRDISPQNILLTFDGQVKIVDFGVAKAAGRSAAETNAGQIKGKPPYMSPEQALGEEIDRRTDLFALGIILYQLTTGKHPFRGESDVITLQNIVSDRPIVAPRAFDKDYPRPLETVVMKALARDPNERYQTAAEFEAALDRVFPPNMPRVRADDVGKFITGLLGERGEKRREALREAIKQADERALNNQERLQMRSMPDLLSQVSLPRVSRPSDGDSVPPSQGTLVDTMTVQLSTHAGLQSSSGLGSAHPSSGHISSLPPPPSGEYGLAHGTPYGTETAAPAIKPKKSGAGLVLGLLLGLAVLGGGAAFAVMKLQPKAEAPQTAVANTAETAPTTAETGTAPEAETVAPDPAAPPGEDAGATLSADELEKETKPANAGGQAPHAGGVGKVKPGPAATASAAPTATTKPKPTSTNGFVPPPVTDPGF
ncbi:MAG: serine/threonine protein kinase [Polyangiaceae bacterium]|nr:serine/threonine protein kinase [Polyangiaceae bacterium]MCB9607878.1 serine/threonine protein kinase [Polyangiaceae bacterium]